MPVRFFVDPKSNSDDANVRRAYGLCVAPPWKDGGHLFINFPEHLEYMPGTKGIARHHDKRSNAWQVAPDGRSAAYEVESLTEPGVFFGVRGEVRDARAEFVFTLTNRTGRTLASIRPLLCHQYYALAGFPAAETDNFAHTFVLIGGDFVPLDRLPVPRPTAHARMAQVRGCADRHNWWAEEMGGFIETPLDAGVTALTATRGARKVLVVGLPGKNLLANRVIPCIHADPCIGDLAPGQTKTVRQRVLFTTASLETLKTQQPWRENAR